MTAVVELTREEFTVERFLPIVEHIRVESGIPFDTRHFFDTWSTWMWAGIARTWAAENCVLGALFTDCLLTGKPRASVMFWFALPAVRGTNATKDLFKMFEQAALDAGCRDIQAAAHETLSPKIREHGFLKNGFSKTETVFTKVL